jgi:hypothetical protein
MVELRNILLGDVRARHILLSGSGWSRDDRLAPHVSAVLHLVSTTYLEHVPHPTTLELVKFFETFRIPILLPSMFFQDDESPDAIWGHRLNHSKLRATPQRGSQRRALKDLYYGLSMAWVATCNPTARVEQGLKGSLLRPLNGVGCYVQPHSEGRAGTYLTPPTSQS